MRPPASLIYIRPLGASPPGRCLPFEHPNVRRYSFDVSLSPRHAERIHILTVPISKADELALNDESKFLIETDRRLVVGIDLQLQP